MTFIEAINTSVIAGMRQAFEIWPGWFSKIFTRALPMKYKGVSVQSPWKRRDKTLSQSKEERICRHPDRRVCNLVLSAINGKPALTRRSFFVKHHK